MDQNLSRGGSNSFGQFGWNELKLTTRIKCELLPVTVKIFI